MVAKPIIDILVEARSLAEIDRREPALVALGYEAMGAFGIDGRRYFRKMTTAGLRTHHLHVFECGSSHIVRHLAFRDHLRTCPDVAAAYGALKTSLSGLTRSDYLDGKAPFIEATERRALDSAQRRESGDA